MSTSRREFLAGSLGAGVAMPFAGAQIAPGLFAAGNAGSNDNILVVVNVRGGYDYLNLLPDVDHPVYQAARPTIAIPKASALPLDPKVSFRWHPNLTGFKALYDRGDLAIVHRVGYPKPNLSHFESEKKWYAADPAAVQVKSGWIGNYLNKAYTGGFQIPAIDFEPRLNKSFTGFVPPVLTNVSTFQFVADRGTSVDTALELRLLRENAAISRAGGEDDLIASARRIVDAFADSSLLQRTGTSYRPAVPYPSSALSTALQNAARFIVGGLKTQIYFTSTGGFDTHSNENARLAPLLTNLGDSVQAFLDDVKAQGAGKKVTIALFTEFSRRVMENGSTGTDHGGAGVAFIAGEMVKGGNYGSYPDLSVYQPPYNAFIDFDSSSIDFRSFFGTLVEKWMGAPHDLVFGSRFPLLGCF